VVNRCHDRLMICKTGFDPQPRYTDAEVAEWQTHYVQGVASNPRVGPTPTFGTNPGAALVLGTLPARSSMVEHRSHKTLVGRSKLPGPTHHRPVAQLG
jgi:hypothetical protein